MTFLPVIGLWKFYMLIEVWIFERAHRLDAKWRISKVEMKK